MVALPGVGESLASNSILYEPQIASSLDAHRGDGKRFVVRADEKMTAFMELESVSLAKTSWRYLRRTSCLGNDPVHRIRRNHEH